MLDLTKIYNEHLMENNKTHFKKRYEGKEEWFHASASGMCMRKHYFQHIAKVKPKPIKEDTMRLFRIGDLIHEDIQDALRQYAERNGSQVYIEREIKLPEVNVRGFLDVLVIEDNIIYDIKTCNAWKWKNLFGRKPDPNVSINYYIQLGTYAWWYEETHEEKLKGMTLLYYNKDNSRMRELSVSTDYIDVAKEYWRDVNKRYKKGNPAIELGVAPVYKWECNIKYCNFFEVCGGGISNMKGDTEL
jgi:CRISPR/Cas system-associated exonuclease Cas4 (RecB family)|tara:strand:- start:193 stop:927 length:735 start_codon:yes stop_codon:yes gene_type:complete